MSEIAFEVPMIPSAKGRPRFARVGKFVRAFTDARTEEAERNFVALAAPHAPATPIEGPLAISLEFHFPAPRSWPRWKLEALERVKHTSRPDADNLAKLVLDALNRSGRFWRDDAQVFRIEATKRYGVVPKTVVRIEEATQPIRGGEA